MDAVPCIMVHGGAWSIPDEFIDSTKKGVCRAAKLGYSLLNKGAHSLDIIEAVITELENDPVFDAGIGSCLTKNYEVEMDACIMDGITSKSGAVACVTSVKNPIQLARKVMTNTEHTLIVGSAADDLARNYGIPKIELEDLLAPHAKKDLDDYNLYKDVINSSFRCSQKHTPGHDTVGAVVLDIYGNLGAGTSTGGITAKLPGRVGDSPIIGSGLFCDNSVGAVSSTGHGEAIARVCLAHRIMFGMQKHLDIDKSVHDSLQYMLSRTSGTGGVIVISNTGEMMHNFTTERMAWCSIQNNIMKYGINHDELFVENLKERPNV